MWLSEDSILVLSRSIQSLGKYQIHAWLASLWGNDDVTPFNSRAMLIRVPVLSSHEMACDSFVGSSVSILGLSSSLTSFILTCIGQIKLQSITGTKIACCITMISVLTEVCNFCKVSHPLEVRVRQW